MQFNFDIINILLLLIVVINTVYGLVIYSLNRRSQTNFLFFLLTVAVSLWGVGMAGFRGFSDPDISEQFARFLYLTAAIIPFSFIYFVYTFPKEKFSFSGFHKKFLPILFVIVAFLAIKKGALILGVVINSNTENEIIFNAKIHFLYAVYIIGYFLWSYILLFRKYFNTKGILHRQIAYTLVGTLVATSIAVVTNLIMPMFGYFSLNWLGQIGVVVMIGSIYYAILKHHLFDVKIIATESFTFILWVFLFVRVLLPQENISDQIINIILLLSTIALGLFLIKSVRKEVKTRQKIEKLAGELEKANVRLRELDRQKTQFLSIASHQFRSPLTAIKGYASLILEGSFGQMTEKMKEPIENILKSAENLVLTVEDFLNISRIEQGRMKYNFEDTDIREMVSEVVEEQRPVVEERGLRFEFVGSKGESYKSKVDVGKMRQVIINLIDNSAKYTPKGSVTVKVDKSHGKILISVKDTGVGITLENKEKLFKMFSRMKNAHKVNVSGTGLGLYVAKQMVEAHKGRIWAESDGVGQGSTFFVELNESIVR